MFLEGKESTLLIGVSWSYGFALGVFVFIDAALGIELGVLCVLGKRLPT